MSKKRKKNNKKKVNNNRSTKEPKFIVEKDGKAYFKDKMLRVVCKPAIKTPHSKYPGFLYEFDYMKKLEWFKKFIILMRSNGGEIRYVGMTEEEFLSLGGKITVPDGYEEVDASKIKKKAGFFNLNK